MPIKTGHPLIKSISFSGAKTTEITRTREAPVTFVSLRSSDLTAATKALEYYIKIVGDCNVDDASGHGQEHSVHSIIKRLNAALDGAR